jgi:hypothetical protein
MVITRMIHDRYHAAKRNPFNEIECSDHYARAMASYGTFITACGFEYHGPNGHMAFDPKLNPEKFKAPFTSAAAWGSFEQEREVQKLRASLLVQYGELSLNSFSMVTLHQVTDIEVMLGDQLIPASFSKEGNRCTLKFSSTIRLVPGQKLSFKV